MAQTPFYRVALARNGRDITDLITSFSFEDCTDQDDLITLRMNNVSLATVDDPDFQPGREILFNFGYLGGVASPRHRAQISSIEPDFGKTITLTIKATDAGVVIKKGDSAKVWKKATSSEIAHAIALKNGLKAVVDKTAHVWDSMPQSNRTDLEFLRYLAGKEEAGSFRVFVKGKTLYFTKLNLKKPSRRTFTWNNGDGTVLSFRPRANETSKSAASASTKAVGVDPLTGKKFEKKADEATAKENTKLGDFTVHYNANGEETGRTRKTATTATAPAKTIIAPGSPLAADNMANKAKKNAAMKDITAALAIEMDPNQGSDEIITMAAVGKRFGGNWYVAKVTHDISRSGATSSLSLEKNASQSPSGAGAAAATKAKDTNKTTGPKQTKTTKPVKVYRYDANANEKK